MLKRVHMTLAVIFRSIILIKKCCVLRLEPGDVSVPVIVTAADVAMALACLDKLVTSNLALALFFPCCHVAAAPFILFRLKREGYSNCTVVATGDGLLVRAKR